MDLKTKLEELAKSSITKIEESESLKEVEELRVKLLGKKGELTDLLKMMRDLSKEERPVIGKLANEIIFVFDGDEAGQKATARAFDLSNKYKQLFKRSNRFD